MAAARNQTHSGGPGSSPTATPRTARTRIGELWITFVTALPGTARERRPEAEDVHVPAPEVSAPQQLVEQVAADEQTGWPTWRNPR